MSDHYYSNKPTVASQLRQVHITLRGFDLNFWTDAGVFSKGQIDFGSELLIETMEMSSDANVLDVGCGYGPIGITASRLVPEGSVTMVDVNERAVELARRNIEANAVTNAEALISDRLAGVEGRLFDCILTNPPIRAGKATVHSIFEQAAAHLTDRGELWVVIQKKQGAPSAKKRLEELFDSVEDVARDAGYRIFRCGQVIRK